MDQMEALTMQNWEHVQVACVLCNHCGTSNRYACPQQFVLNNLNQMPKESHDVDFSRIKPWYLDGQ